MSAINPNPCYCLESAILFFGHQIAASFPTSSVADHAESQNTLCSNSVTHAHMCTHTRWNKQRLGLACFKALPLRCWTSQQRRTALGVNGWTGNGEQWSGASSLCLSSNTKSKTENMMVPELSVKGIAAVYTVAIFAEGSISMFSSG